MSNKTAEIISEIKKVIVGKDEIIQKVFMAILSSGHILLEDVPGVGKTTLALSFSRALGLDYKRIQFTPDSVPSDITGFSIYNKNTGNFEYMEGTAVTNLLLADEINRASSRTQSALLEVMEEGNITVDGVTREIEKPFIVIATQNPAGSLGTQMLPNSQMDRFMVKLKMGYPATDSLIHLMKDRHNSNPLEGLKPIIGKKELLAIQKEVKNIHIAEEIYQYIANLIEETRAHKMVQIGVSPRGALALCRMAKANAYVMERQYVIPEDVVSVFSEVCAHRMILQAKARVNEITADDISNEIIEKVQMPGMPG